MKFHYKAQAKTGIIIEDTIEAESRDAVVDRLRTMGATPILVEEPQKKPLSVSIPFIDNLVGGVKLQDKIVFSKNLSQMIRAGLSMSRALDVLKRQTRKKQFKEIIESISNEIKTGGSLSSGLEKYPTVFSPLFVGMVRAGEEAGNVADNLIELAEQLEKTYDLRKKVKGAMIYPTVIITAMLIIGVLMFVFVVPTLLETFREFDLDLPITTQIVIFVSDFIQANTVLFFGILFALVISVITLLRLKSTQKYVDFVIIKVPVVGGIAREMNSALTARTMSSLLSSGLSVQKTLEVTRQVVQNARYQATIDRALEYVEQGGQISRVFKERTDLYPVMVGEMMEVGEETGKLSDMLRDVAKFYEGEVESKTKNLSTIIEPILMLIIGGAVGFFAVSMMSPMYSLLDGIQ
jgi:type IV pilus assembly protein PilC